MNAAPHYREPDTPGVRILTREEWEDFTRESLEELGLAYEELAQQARDRDFTSGAALCLWVVIGEKGA